MKSTFFKKIIVLVLSFLSIEIIAQCDSITNLNVILGANGTASISPVISGTVSPTMTMYYWQISPSGAINSNQFQSQGEFQFYANGTYNVCLVFSDSLNGCVSNQYCTNLTITNLPASSCHADFTAYSDSNCVTYFNNTSTGNNITYDWLINGNHLNTTNPIVNLPNGNYSVLLKTYFAGQPCDSISHNITVACSGNNTVSCVANFTSYTDSTCTTYITNTSTGNNLTYEWYDITNNSSPSLISTASDPILNLPQGYTTLQLATFSNGTFCDSAINYVYVDCGNPAISCQAYANFIVFPDSTNIGSGVFYIYNLSSGNGTISYLWDFGDGNTSTQMYPTHQYVVPGHYVVCLTTIVSYTNSIGSSTCSSTHCDSSSVQKMSAGFLMSQISVIPQTVNSIKSIEKETYINAFPNPMDDKLIIEVTSGYSNKLSYKLIDSLGRLILNGDINNETSFLNTTNLEKGFYTLTIIDNSGKHLKTIKLVK